MSGSSEADPSHVYEKEAKEQMRQERLAGAGNIKGFAKWLRVYYEQCAESDPIYPLAKAAYESSDFPPRGTCKSSQFVCELIAFYLFFHFQSNLNSG